MRREHDIRVRVTDEVWETENELLDEVRKQWEKAYKQGRK